MNSTARRLRFENLELRRLLAAVSIPDDLSGDAGAEVAAPVRIDSAAGVRGAEVRIRFDPTVLSLDADDITAGTVWSGATDTQVVANVDPVAGTVVVFISASADLPNVAGSLVEFGFNLRETAAAGTSSEIDLVQVRLNEGAVPVTPAPAAGADPTDGRITVSDSGAGLADRISGTVYADTNNDNLPGEFEGIPGVKITLVNTSSGATRETTTGDDGKYEFTGVAAGSYRIVQTQPAAYANGGLNEITVSLAQGQNLANQNFRELGLQPQFVPNRLFTTAVRPVGSPAWVQSLRAVNIAALAASSTEVASLSEPVILPPAAPQPLVSPASIDLSPTVATNDPAAAQPETEQAPPAITLASLFASAQPDTKRDEAGDTTARDAALAQLGLW
jgi:hypothetical protein